VKIQESHVSMNTIAIQAPVEMIAVSNVTTMVIALPPASAADVVVKNRV